MRALLPLVALAMSSGLAAQTPAEPTAPSAGAEQGSVDIVVNGTREEVRHYLGDLLQQSGGQLSRIEDGFCPKVIGYDPEYQAIIENLIRKQASDLGVTVLEPGCTTNALVVFTHQPQKLLEYLRDRAPNAFGRIPVAERKRLSNTVRGSYAWHATTPVARDGGGDGVPLSALTSSPAAKMFEGVPTFRSPFNSRLFTQATYSIRGAHLILDSGRTPGMTLGQIAAFATVNLLVDLDVDAVERAREDSILRLFEADDPSAVAKDLGAFESSMIATIYSQEDLAKPASQMRMRIAKEMSDED